MSRRFWDTRPSRKPEQRPYERCRPMSGEYGLMLHVAGRVSPEREPGHAALGGAASRAAQHSNLEIARSIPLRPIADIAERLGILDDELHPFGRHVAKIDG